MKSKQYLLVVLSVLILLLFITSASAAEINETDGISIDEPVNLENNLLSVDNNVKSNEIMNDTLKESNSELLTAGNEWYVNSSKTSSGDGKSEADAFKTLNEALTNNELQDYDTIMIASGEYKGINDNIGLTIVKNLNFIKYGDGEAIFDAEGLSRILTVNSTSVNITGLTFKNGNSTDGGAIFISHEIDESNIKATFINNTAVEKGGAIYIVSGGISGNLNSIFINNTASSWGGAIYIDSGGISGNVNGTFINNKGSSGSAIFIAGDISGNVNGTFINNEAEGLGAIYIYNGDASGNVKGTFINNIANRGGAIAVGDDGTVSGNIKGTFINNTGYYAGGAICIANSERYPTGNLEGIFINNKAESGGAIYIEFSYENPVVSLGGTFINNNASSGGAIHINQMFAPVTIQDSIFLNNSDALSFGLGDYIKTVDCWFGNNATNYNVRPDAGKAVMDRWLFLNATANPADVSIDENSIIAFKLDSYDNSSGKVKPYDASKMNIILDLTQTLGDLDKTAASIDENITYTARQGGNSCITGKYETVSYTIELNNVKLPTEINVINSTIALKANEEVDAGATLSPTEAGNLTYTSNNTDVVIVENGKIKSIKKGNATITVSFAGDERYAPADNKTISVSVSLIDTSVAAENMTLNVGESGIINYTVTPEELKVNFVADNSGVVSVDEDGTVKALKNGTANITINVGDDEVYAKNSAVITVTVNLNDASVVAEDMELNVSESGVINYTVNPEGLNVTFVVDNSGIVSVDENGTVKALKEGKTNVTLIVGDGKVYVENSTIITITVSRIPTMIAVNDTTFYLDVGDEVDPGVSLIPSDAGELDYVSSDVSVVVVNGDGTFTAVGNGTANITVSFSGNEKFEPAESKIIDVTVSKIPTEIFVRNATVDMKIGDEVDSGVRISPSDAGELDYVSSDVSVVRVDGDGTFVAVAEGSANVTVSFSGNEKFEPAESKIITVTVSKIPTEIFVRNATLDLSVGDNTTIFYELIPEDAEGDVRFMSNDTSIVYADAETGIIIGRGAGTASVSVSYFGNDKYESSKTTVTVNVNKLTSVVSAQDVTVKQGDANGKFIATLTNAEGVPLSANIVINLNGVDYAMKTNSKGHGVVSTANLTLGEYTATVTYKGNSKYNPSNTTAKVTVNKLDSVVSADDVSVNVGDAKGKFVATLTNAEGAPLSANIVINLNGIDYAMKTNSKGHGVVSTANLTPGEYTATVTYKGNSRYNPSNTTAKVTVNKLDSVVSADDVSVNLGDEKGRFIATLTNAEGIPLSANVYVTLNGVTYAQKSNSKGHVVIPTGDLDMGEYVATVVYKGNSRYNPSNTTAKVSVRLGCVVSADDVIVKAGDANGKFVATLTNLEGIPLSANVVVTINGVKYSQKSNSKGQVIISTKDLEEGEYIATVEYKGNSRYNPSSTTAKITVNDKFVSVVSADDVFVQVGDPNSKFIAKLTNDSGKPLSANMLVTINGVTYSMKSDSKGQVVIPTEDLEEGEYIATVTYKGNSRYNPSSTTAKVVVNNMLTSCISGSYNAETQEVIGTLTNSAGTPLSANVVVSLNGKDYAMKSNSKGQFKVSTADLSPGSYTAKLVYKGNSKYNPSSTTVNVVIQ